MYLNQIVMNIRLYTLNVTPVKSLSSFSFLIHSTPWNFLQEKHESVWKESRPQDLFTTKGELDILLGIVACVHTSLPTNSQLNIKVLLKKYSNATWVLISLNSLIISCSSILILSTQLLSTKFDDSLNFLHLWPCL